MAQENVEVVRRAYDATNHGDYDIVESLFHNRLEIGELVDAVIESS